MLKQKNLLGVIGIVIVAISLCSLGWFNIYKEQEHFEGQLLQGLENTQAQIVDQSMRRLMTFIEGSSEDDKTKAVKEQEIVTGFMDQLPRMAQSYWLLWNLEGVVFVQSKEHTATYQDMSLEELLASWEYQGGSGLEGLEAYLQETPKGRLSFVKDAQEGEVVMIYASFEVGNESYTLASLSQKAYWLQQVGYTNHQHQRVIQGIVITAVFAIAIAAYCIYLLRSSKRCHKMSEEIQAKNRLVQEMKGLLDKNKEDIQAAYMFDLFTGAYNRHFFDICYEELDKEIFCPIGFAFVKVNGYDKEGGALRSCVQSLEAYQKESDFVARIKEDLFVLVKLGCDQEAMQTLTKALEQTLEENLKPLGSHFIASYVIKEEAGISFDSLSKPVISEIELGQILQEATLVTESRSIEEAMQKLEMQSGILDTPDRVAHLRRLLIGGSSDDKNEKDNAIPTMFNNSDAS